MPGYWILKTEPTTYSFERLAKEGRAVWDGITNPTALIHLRTMRRGDEAVVYHTGSVKAAVGLARIASNPYADPRKKDPKLVVVELEPVRPLAKPVPLAAIRANRAFKDCALVKISRLSVVPMADGEWRELMRMAGK